MFNTQSIRIALVFFLQLNPLNFFVIVQVVTIEGMVLIDNLDLGEVLDLQEEIFDDVLDFPLAIVFELELRYEAHSFVDLS